jgi:hypothetical protein
MTDEPSTINAWFYQQPGPINLRVRHVQRRPDLHSAEYFLLAIVIGAAVVAWLVAAIRWFL